MATTPIPGNQTPVRVTYTASGITFAKATLENKAIALTQSGVGELTNVINPITLATGVITTNGTTAVSGVGTTFEDDFKAGDFLFEYDNEGSPILVGRIAQIASNTSLTLSSAAPSSNTGVYCGMMNIVLSGNETLLIRIPVPINTVTNLATLPNWNAYRNLVTGFNNNTNNSLERYSDIDSPQTAATPPLQNVEYTITAIYNFQSFQTTVNGQAVTRNFQTADNFPQFCFAEFNPGADAYAANTLYKLFASERFNLNGISVTTNYNPNFLTQAGY
jgi:hypothetical protein